MFEHLCNNVEELGIVDYLRKEINNYPETIESEM